MRFSRKRLWLIGALVLLSVVAMTALAGLNAQNRNQKGDDLAALRAQRIAAQIAEMRAEIKANGWPFTVGDNPAMHREIEELAGFNPALKRPLRFVLAPPGKKPGETVPPTALPASFMSQHVTAVKNQLNCGSCWAFGSLAAFETAIHLQTGVEYDLSEQYVVSCNPFGWGCDGGWWPYDMFVAPGLVPEPCFPYSATDEECKLTCVPYFFANGAVFLAGEDSVASVAEIKQAIYDRGGVCVGVYVDRWFQAYTGGVMTKCARNPRSVNHMVQLVGWDDTKGAWRLKNSWGTSWGEAGFMWIKYGCNLVGYGASYVDY